MAFFSTIKKLLTKSFLSGLESAVETTMHKAETRAEEIIEAAEEKATKFLHNLVKGAILFFLALTGFIFALAGLGNYLSETVNGLSNGVGYIVIGIIMLVLVIFAKVLQKE